MKHERYTHKDCGDAHFHLEERTGKWVCGQCHRYFKPLTVRYLSGLVRPATHSFAGPEPAPWQYKAARTTKESHSATR